MYRGSQPIQNGLRNNEEFRAEVSLTEKVGGSSGAEEADSWGSSWQVLEPPCWRGEGPVRGRPPPTGVLLPLHWPRGAAKGDEEGTGAGPMIETWLLLQTTNAKK